MPSSGPAALIGAASVSGSSPVRYPVNRELPWGDEVDEKRGIFTLHRYFIWADRMRVHFFDLLDKDHEENEVGLLLYMSYWYAGMYVVIEGWRELGLTDPTIDALLASSNVDLLRRYRHGVFHFQETYFDARLTDFVSETSTPGWMSDLREAFSNWFLQWLKDNGESVVV